MMTNSALLTALDLAAKQLDAAQEGRFDDVLALLGEYEHACSAVAATVTKQDEDKVRQLIAANARIGTLVALAAADAGQRMARLNGKRSLTSAYFATNTPAAFAADASA